MSQSTSINDNDVTVNRYALSVADFTKAAQSWLGPDVSGKSLESGTANLGGLDDELVESELQPTSELSGIGYVPPSNLLNDLNSVGSREKSFPNEKLRQQMLGKRFRSSNNPSRTENARYGLLTELVGPKPLPKRDHRRRDDMEEEDEGRSQLVGRKKSSNLPSSRDSENGKDHPEQDNPNLVSVGTSVGSPAPADTARKRGTSFLDEILAERAGKRQKQKKKKKQNR